MPGGMQLRGREQADVLRALLPALETTGVMLLLEPLAPDTTNFLTTAAEAGA